MVNKALQASDGLVNVAYVSKEKQANRVASEKSAADALPSSNEEAASLAEGGLIERLLGNCSTASSVTDIGAAQGVLKLIIDQMKEMPITNLFKFSDQSRSHLFQLIS